MTVSSAAFLPTTAEEIRAQGLGEVDIVFVSGDAYIDHPSFSAAILCRWLEKHGFRTAILAQPDWKSADPWRSLGRPRLFYAVSAGNMDSMINHYTANRKRRNQDAYSPGGRIDLRPDRPTAVYAQRCREAFPGVPVVTGGVEASLRRIAHYDYWSDKVLPGSLLNSKADLLGFGMGEQILLHIAQRLSEGEGIRDLRDMRGVAYLLGKNEELPIHDFDLGNGSSGDVLLPSYEDVRSDKRAFARATRLLHHETNPHNGRRLIQAHGDRRLVINPPDLPLDEATMDAIYGLPFTRLPAPRYTDPIPAWEMIRDSVQIMRGCFGGCTFCSITMHQGRAIQSRSPDSILREVKKIADASGFKGHISDLGGPTANMYRMRCTEPQVEARCRRLSCIHPSICKLLDTSHKDTIHLMREARAVKGVAKVHIASGIRTDLARFDEEYLDELAAHHVGGHLKVAPEHASPRVLQLMKKPGVETFDDFAKKFHKASRKAGKDQYLVPYLIGSHPGSRVEDMIDLAIFLKQRGYKPEQVQDFIPAPMDIATCMFYTGLDPMTMKPVETATRLKDRQVQRALMQFFAPENYHTVRRALIDAGRRDLIGRGKDCLIPDSPPKEARQKGRKTGKPRKPGGGYRSSARNRR